MAEIVKVGVGFRGQTGVFDPAEVSRFEALAEGAAAAAGQAVDGAGAATAAAERAEGAAEAAVGEVAGVKADIDHIRDGAAMNDGTVDLLQAVAPGEAVGRSVLALTRNGILARVDPEMADDALRKGAFEIGPLLDDGSRDVIVVEGRAVMRLHPDGLEFRRHGGDPGGELADGWASANGRISVQAGQHGILHTERVSDRGGVRYPAPLIGGVSRKAVIISLYGQSNADVTRMGEQLVWRTPPFPYNCFQLNDLSSNTNRGGIKGWQGVVAPGASGMVNLSEGADNMQSYGAVALSRLLAMDGVVKRVGLVRSSANGGMPLVGVGSGAGIWKNGDGAYSAAWNNWRRDLTDAHSALSNEGYEVSGVYILFTHQEADWQTPRAQYAADFLAMKAEKEALIATDLPGIPVQWFVDQASGSGRRVGMYNGGLWPSRLAIQDAAIAGGPNITMVLPRYMLNFGYELDGVTREDIHTGYAARIWQGEIYAHAIRAKEQGNPWHCPHPVDGSARISGNTITVDFHALQPLVLDQTFCRVRPDMGFTVAEGAIAVQRVYLSGQRQVSIECASSPVGATLDYAYRNLDAQDVSDGWPISTGALRDAWETPSLFDPGKKLVRPALAFRIQL